MTASGAGSTDPHHFSNVGKDAEAMVTALAEETFFIDWCFPNPRLPDGKELCDLLLVFGSSAVIWQVKRVREGSKPAAHTRARDKSIRQLAGAKRQLFGLKTPVQLGNARRGLEPFDPDGIREVFLISASVGSTPIIQPGIIRDGEGWVHLVDREFLGSALSELDTMQDFLGYLREKERFYSAQHAQVLALSGEPGLLAYYIMNERSFKGLEGLDLAVIDTDWGAVASHPDYLWREKENRISYGWDSIINRAHEGGPGYEAVARELARPSRFERRVLARSFMDAASRANQLRDKNLFRRVFYNRAQGDGSGTTYCFLFASRLLGRAYRRASLEALCTVARTQVPRNRRVLGIATEMTLEPECSYDFVLLDIPEITPSLSERAQLLTQKAGIMRSPSRSGGVTREYPEEI